MPSEYFLSRGAHRSREEGMCSMEWVSFIAGEPHSDRPACVDPTLAWYCMCVNDALGDEDRQRLRPYLARCIGTAGDELEHARDVLMGDLSAWIHQQHRPMVGNPFTPFIREVGVDGALRLLDVMLPTELIEVPALPDVAAELTGVAA